MTGEFDFAAGQIQGGRSYQEDRYAIRRVIASSATAPGVLAVLADGMGGHAAGAEAAEIVVKAVFETAAEHGFAAPNFYLSALDAANRAIARESAEHPEREGMGATLVALYCDEGAATWISVGDSPVLLVRDGNVDRINADHSLAPRIDAAAERGEITFEEAQASAQRHVLLSAVAGGPIDHIDLHSSPFPLVEQDCLIIASDGIETLHRDEIGALVEKYAKHPSSELVSALLKAVEGKRVKNQDNTTVIAIRVHPAGGALPEDIPTRTAKTRRVGEPSSNFSPLWLFPMALLAVALVASIFLR